MSCRRKSAARSMTRVPAAMSSCAPGQDGPGEVVGNLVPAFDVGDVLQAEIGGQVDDAGAGGDELLR
ncbi:hypothetical protein CTI14_69505, partial [Methylobacterium radiotolerans]